MQVFAELRARLRLEAFEFFTDRALHHVLAHGGQAPFADVHPYYVIAAFAMQGEADEVALLAAFEHCTERGWVADGVLAQGDGQAAPLWRLRAGISESLARHAPSQNKVSVRVPGTPTSLHVPPPLRARGRPWSH